MRWIAVASFVLLCVVATAPFAQDQPAPALAPFTPAFEFDREIVARTYPTGALERGVAGIAHLCCQAREDRSLDCRVGAEWPEAYHFDRAGLYVARLLRLTPDSYTQLQARPQRTFLLPLRWHARPVPRGFDAVVANVEEQTANICGPDTGRARAENYILIEGVRIRLRSRP